MKFRKFKSFLFLLSANQKTQWFLILQGCIRKLRLPRYRKHIDEQSSNVLPTGTEETQQSSRVQLTLNGQVSQALERHLESDIKAQIRGSSEVGPFVQSCVPSLNRHLFWQARKGVQKAAKIFILLQAQKFHKIGWGLISDQ